MSDNLPNQTETESLGDLLRFYGNAASSLAMPSGTVTKVDPDASAGYLRLCLSIIRKLREGGAFSLTDGDIRDIDAAQKHLVRAESPMWMMEPTKAEEQS